MSPSIPGIQAMLQKASSLMSGKRIFWVLFILILGIGVFARTWEYRKLPPGINVDEASIGVDAYDLYKFGMDRNGVSFPTQFIAFGQEQNALYGYLLIPFIAVLGLKVAVVRLPMLIIGILTMPLAFFVAKRAFNTRLGLLSMFFLAISPWHIFLSRMGLDINLFPFVFTLGFACLLLTVRSDKWFIPTCFFFALCFYSYGPSYFIVPFVLAGSIWILLSRKLITRQTLVAGLALFSCLAIPISLFIIINTFGLNSIHMGPVTIPRLPSPPRFLSETSGFRTNLLQTLAGNLWSFLKLLFSQTDRLIYNVYDPYGYFYRVTFPFAVLGMILLFYQQRFHFSVEIQFLLFWISACLIFGVLQPVNINRINIIFIPLLLCIALFLDWLGNIVKPAYIIAIVGLFIGFISFNIDYHGPTYMALAADKFRPGLLPAIQYASGISQGPICVTNEPDHPDIYVLFVEQANPEKYLGSIQYNVDIPGPYRYVLSLLRYTFGKQYCPHDRSVTYVLRVGEIHPTFEGKYDYKFFENYVVYNPRP
jgi:4-amino-4-deoxy-L-arabinose transferase-like glycosyltransferase